MGSARCLTVRYEELVLNPATIMRRILAFLDLPWHQAVLRQGAPASQIRPRPDN